MSENDRGLRAADIRAAAKVLTIVLVAVAGTFLYVRSGETAVEVEAPRSTGTDVYRAKKDGGMSTASRGHGKLLAIDDDDDNTTARNNAKDNRFAEPKRERAADGRGQKLDGRSVAEDSRATGRSLNTSVVEAPTVSRIGTSQQDVDKTGRPYLVADKSDGGPTAVDQDPRVVVDIGYKLENTPPAAGYSNDLFYDSDGGADGYGGVKGYGPTAEEEPKDERSSAPVEGGFSNGGGYGQVPSSYVFKARRRRPAAELDYDDEDFRERGSPPIENKIDWRHVGVLMALGKLGLFKLLTVAFLQYVFVLWFKLKLFAIATFFKFLLLLKLAKVSNVLALPSLFASLLPVILTSRFNNTQAPAPTATPGLDILSSAFNAFSSQASSSSQGGGSFVGGFFSGFVPAADPVPGGGLLGGSPLLGGGLFRNLFRETRSARAHKRSDLFEKRRAEESAEFDLITTMLESEKCADKIACRTAAVAEKSGVVPVWIDRILSGLSKIIPEAKLQSYFKTYDEIKNEFHTKSLRNED